MHLDPVLPPFATSLQKIYFCQKRSLTSAHWQQHFSLHVTYKPPEIPPRLTPPHPLLPPPRPPLLPGLSVCHASIQTNFLVFTGAMEPWSQQRQWNPRLSGPRYIPRHVKPGRQLQALCSLRRKLGGVNISFPRALRASGATDWEMDRFTIWPASIDCSHTTDMRKLQCFRLYV